MRDSRKKINKDAIISWLIDGKTAKTRREKVSDSKCNLVKIENLCRNYFTQVLLTGAEPFQDSFVLRRSQA